MFGRLMNSYYYGKSGKGDFRKDDLPKNRWQLFFEMLRVRISGLCRLNLMTCLAWLPMIYVIAMLFSNFMNMSSVVAEMTAACESAGATELYQQLYLAIQAGTTTLEAGAQQLADAVTAAAVEVTNPENINIYMQILLSSSDVFNTLIAQTLLYLIPCILITGPVSAGLAYVTRNWARDEHAFAWADFKDAVKGNWKQALGVSAITSVVPLIMYVCYRFYGQMAGEQGAFYIVPQMLVLVLGAVWLLGLTFMYPMMVSYKMNFRTLLKNSLLMSIARLPQTIGARLAALFPVIIALAVAFLTPYAAYALMALAGYYILLGNGMTRFIIASFTNAVFDRFINSRIEGVAVNRGLSQEDDDDDEPEQKSEDAPQQ